MSLQFTYLSTSIYAFRNIYLRSIIFEGFEVNERNQTSFPYFGVKLSCVCLMIAYKKNCLKLPKGDLMNVTLR